VEWEVLGEELSMRVEGLTGQRGQK